MRSTDKSPTNIYFRQKFSTNLTTSIVYFTIQFIFGIAIVPYFLDSLGEVAYGMIPLATSLTSYVIMILDSMNAAQARFLAVDIQKGENEQSSITYNTVFFTILAMVLILVPISIAISLVIPSFFNIGDTTNSSVVILFALVLISSSIRILVGPCTSIFVAYNRLDYTNYTHTTNIGIQLVSVVVLFAIYQPSLELVGISYILGACASVFVAYTLSKKVAPYLHINRDKFSWFKFKAITEQTLWTLLSIIGGLMRYSLCIIIANKLLGEVISTEFSLIVTLVTALFGVCTILPNTMRPQIYLYRSQENKVALVSFNKKIIKFIGLISAWPIALLCAFSPLVLSLWIGNDYAKLYSLVYIMAIPVLYQAMAQCPYYTNAAYLKTKIPALVSCLIGLICFTLAILIPSIFNNGIMGIGIGCSISIVLMSMFESMYDEYVLNTPKLSLISMMIPATIALILLICVSNIYSVIMTPQTLLDLIIACMVISVFYFIILRFTLTKEDRQIIKGYLPQKITIIIPKWIF